jgi:hypothetical protein
MPAEKLTLANLGGGELSLLVDREICKLCDNIADPNVKTEAVRKITVTIAVKPDKKGQTADVRFAVKSALPGPDASTTTAYIAMAPGTTDITLFGMDIRQQDLFGEKKEALVSEIVPTAVSGPQIVKTADPMKPGSFAPPMGGAAN